MSDDKRKVVPLRGTVVVPPGPNPEVVAELEEWLERARSGEIIGCVVCAVYRDYVTGCRRAGLVSRALIGQLFSAASRISRLFDDAEEEDSS